MMIALVVLWALMALTVLALFIWRKTVSRKEDDNLHVSAGAADRISAEQSEVAQKLEIIDMWGKRATVVTVVFGLIVGGIFLYQSWMQTSNLGA